MLEFFAGVAIGTIIGVTGTFAILWLIDKAYKLGERTARLEEIGQQEES